MNPIYLQALSFQDVQGPNEDCIYAAADMAAELGIAGIDIEDRLLKSYEPHYLQALAHQIESRGIRIGYCGLIVDFNAPISSIPDELNRAKLLLYAIPYLGVESIRIPGNGVVGRQSTEGTFNAVRSKFQQVLDNAEGSGVTVYLHNHNHGSVPSTGEQVLRLVNELNNPGLSYVLDTGQFQGSPGASGEGSPSNIAQDELYESIDMCAPIASMVRAKFYFAQSGPERWLDYPRIVTSLKKSRFEGPISIVYEPKGTVPSTDALPLAVRDLIDLLK